MFDFFLWSVGILSVTSMIINYISDIHYLHPNLIRINQFLMYTVAVISAISMYVYKENKMIFYISILGFIISLMKSFLYCRTYVIMKADEENDEEENNKNEED